MNRVCEVENRVQLMSWSSERADWLSLAYFLLAHFSLFSPFYLPPFSFTSLFLSPVPQPLLSPSFSGSQLYKGVWVRASEWALWRQSIPYQLLPNADTLTSLTANDYFFMTQPGAITATSLRCILLLLQLSERCSWWDPGGAETSVSQSLPDLCKDRLTDRKPDRGGRSAKRK